MNQLLPNASSILFLIALTGCGDPYHLTDKDRAEAKDRAEIAQHLSAYEAIEKEAHSQSRNWMHVIFGKYDGRCEAVTTSARAQMEAMHPSGFALVGADKYNDAEYAVEYRARMEDKDYIYVTSLRLCNEIIQHNISK
jgi:hypothetical protein